MDRDFLKTRLSGLPVPEIRAFDVIGSTNDEALTWATQGAQNGCLVIADAQTQGRGRLQRRWVTNPGAALAFSLILIPQAAELGSLALFSPLGALAICQALEENWQLKPEVKWPNDVLLMGRKTAGILTEVNWLGDHLQAIVIGIGINVKPSAVPPDSQVLFPATCVEQAVQRTVDRYDLLYAVLKALFDWRQQLQRPHFLKSWEKRLAFMHEWVKLSEDGERPQQSRTGQILGIDPSGGLLLRLDSGEETMISVGDVHLRPLDENK